MNADRNLAIFLIALVLGAHPDPAGAIPRAPEDLSRTPLSPDFDGGRAAISAERLRSWLANSLSREGLSVRRRGGAVEIDPKVTIRTLHGVIAGLPGDYRVHVVVEGREQSRVGVIGEITSRIVLQREDSGITRRLNAVRAYSFTVERASDGSGTAPRVALGFDLPSGATPFAWVEVRRERALNGRGDKQAEPVLKKSPRRQITPAASASAESTPLVDAVVARAPDDFSQPPPAAWKAPTEMAGASASMADVPSKAKAGSTQVAASGQQSPKYAESVRAATAAGAEPSAAASSSPAPAIFQTAATVVARQVPAKIDSILFTANPTGPWPAEFRVVKARVSAQRRAALRPFSPLQTPEVFKLAPEPGRLAPQVQARETLRNNAASTPASQAAVNHAPAGLPASTFLLLLLAGIAIVAGARLPRRRINALPRSAAVAPSDLEPRERMNPSTAAQTLLFEEIQRTAERIQKRGRSTQAERLLEIVDREQRRLLGRAA